MQKQDASPTLQSTESAADGHRGLAPVPDVWEYWDGTPQPRTDLLRWGYTTGACVAGALVASLLSMNDTGVQGLSPDQRASSVSLLFGDGRVRSLPLGPEMAEFPGFSVIRKNGGDDPDCTHGILIAARLRRVMPNEAIDSKDVLCRVGEADIYLHALCGVGLVTLDGLDCAKGHWAINPGVVRMIAANLERAGLSGGTWIAEIAIPDGESLASRTLNKTLGVKGGLSLLGTTGLVRPFSHEAYIASVRLALRCAAKLAKTAFLCTGTRTMAAARQWVANSGMKAVPADLPAECFVSIADFLGDSLREASKCRMERVIVCCMPGKLLKYAAGYDNTHAHKVAQAMELLLKAIVNLFPERQNLERELADLPSMRAMLPFFSREEQTRLFTSLAKASLQNFAALATASDTRTPPAFAILLTDFNGTPEHFFPDTRFSSLLQD